MIILISPAKSLDFESPLITKEHSQPQFIEQSAELITQLKKLAPQEIASLMKLSDQLAVLNFDRFQAFKPHFTIKNARQALLAFKGDVYQSLNAEDFSSDDFDFAQKHLRILSGLYGLLRPLDLIQAYRLEMGTRFNNSKGKNLYEFWDLKLTHKVTEELNQQEKPVLINLASNEYFKAIKTQHLTQTIITPSFKDWKNGEYKMISFYAKRARGLMSRYIIKNKIEDPQQLKDFNLGGYYFDEERSTENNWMFLRDNAS